MAIGDPSTPFLSVRMHGVRAICVLGRPVPGSATVPFEILATGGAVDLDAPRPGHWSPSDGVLVVGGAIVAMAADAACGRWLVIERDGTGTVETDSSRDLDEDEILVSPSFLDSVEPGRRMAALRMHAADDDAEEDRIADALDAEDHVLGSAGCRL